MYLISYLFSAFFVFQVRFGNLGSQDEEDFVIVFSEFSVGTVVVLREVFELVIIIKNVVGVMLEIWVGGLILFGVVRKVIWKVQVVQKRDVSGKGILGRGNSVGKLWSEDCEGCGE